MSGTGAGGDDFEPGNAVTPAAAAAAAAATADVAAAADGVFVPGSADAGLPVGERPADPLHAIICAGDTAALRMLHSGSQTSVDLEQPWSRRHPSLAIEVVRRGHASMLEFMIEAGIDLGVLTSFGGTLLMGAAYTDHIQVARLLLDKGGNANINEQSGSYQATALHLCQQVEMARLLILHGADWRITNAQGYTAREVAGATSAWGDASNEELVDWLEELELHGGSYGRWLCTCRMPLICLHRLAVAVCHDSCLPQSSAPALAAQQGHSHPGSE